MPGKFNNELKHLLGPSLPEAYLEKGDQYIFEELSLKQLELLVLGDANPLLRQEIESVLYLSYSISVQWGSQERKITSE